MASEYVVQSPAGDRRGIEVPDAAKFGLWVLAVALVLYVVLTIGSNATWMMNVVVSMVVALLTGWVARGPARRRSPRDTAGGLAS